MSSSENHGMDLENLIKSMDAFSEKGAEIDDYAKTQLFASAHGLCQRIEPPWARIARMYWAEVRNNLDISTQHIFSNSYPAIDRSGH